MKLWIIGGSEGSTGHAIAHAADLDGRYTEILVSAKENLDVRDWYAIREFVEENGPFDQVLYGAGVASLRWIRDLEESDVQDMYSVNLFGFLQVLRMLDLTQARGRVLALTSDAAQIPMRGSIEYCSSKAALEMAVRCAARELAPYWQINGLSPSAIENTSMTKYIDETIPEFRNWSPHKAKEYELSQIPMGRRAKKEEIAQVALSILNGPEFLTGSIVRLTGGK